jgi:protein-S-isoprenylcysteine O-methyltransferase Ste14
MKNEVQQATILFVAMVVIYAVLVIIAASIGDAFAKSLLVSTGSAILGGGLAFFLIRMFQLKK